MMRDFSQQTHPVPGDYVCSEVTLRRIINYWVVLDAPANQGLMYLPGERWTVLNRIWLRNFLPGAEAGNDGNILDLEKSPAPPMNLEHV
jgi:hypothetical protein